MTNLTTHMAELRKILASIENKNIIEGLGSIVLGGASEQIFKDGIKGLAKQEAKFIIKQLGEDVVVNVMRNSSNKKAKIEVELVLKKIADRDAYQIVTQNGKSPKPGKGVISAEQVASDVEKAVEAGRPVKTSGALQIKATSETAQQAARNADGMTDEQLEASIKNTDLSPVLRKEYKEILEKRKASKTGDAESIKREVEMEKKRIAGKSDADLQALYNNPNATAESRQAAKEELARRGIKPEAPKVEPTPAPKVEPEAPKAEPTPAPKVEPEAPKADAPKTADEVLQAKKTAVAEKEAKEAIDAGEVQIKGLLDAKPGELPHQRVIRSLEEKPELLDKWSAIKGTKGEEGFWQYVKRRKVATLLTALTVAGIAAGVYNSSGEPEEIDNEPGPEEVTGNADTTNQSDAETARLKRQNNAAGTEKEQGASTTAEKDDKDDKGDKDSAEAGDAAVDSAEQDALLTQINALIDELSKSKDPAIQKRLAAVRAKLGQSEQAASVKSKDDSGVASGWYDIGRGYQRWYGPDGVDPKTGRRVKTGTTDIIPIDNRPRDKFQNMSQDELASLARKNANATAKTKSNW